MSSVKRAVINSQDIIDAYDVHKENFLIIDIDNIRNYKNYCNYINVHIKKASGEVISPIYCKTIGSGLTTSSNIREPEVRQYEQIRIAFKKYDEVDGEKVENINMTAMDLLCNSYRTVMQTMIDKNIITHSKEKPRKKNNEGLLRPVLLISTEAKTPLQTTITNKITGDVEVVDNPTFWINLPKKIYRKGTAPEPKQFNNLFYKDDDGIDSDKKFLIYEFDATFYDIEKRYYNQSTGKRTYKLLGEKINDNIVLDNTNVHKFIPKGSKMIGSFKFGVTVSSRGAKLDIMLSNTFHIKKGENEIIDINTEEELSGFESILGLNKDESDDDDDSDYDNIQT